MKTKIRVIDLFNKIANDELKRGTKIIYQGTEYIYDFPNLCGIYVDGNASKENLFGVLELDCESLNYEVTIIEEIEKPKEIEGFGHYNDIYIIDERFNSRALEAINRLNAKSDEQTKIINYLLKKEADK